jgi:chemotaxis family two-component system response regulator Rcp1
VQKEAAAMGNNMVLLAEDNPSDARLIKEAFLEAGLTCDINTVNDGVEVMDYLANAGTLSRPLPRIIILDVKMPRKNGIEVLQDLKSNSTLKDIPVIMLTNSDSRDDILEAYSYETNAYMTKPLVMSELIEIVKYIYDTWIK